MPSNDEVVWGIPTIQCPVCQSQLALSGPKIEKYSKQQREKMHCKAETNTCTPTYWEASSRKGSAFDVEDAPDDSPDNAFMVVSCQNHHCPQYSKIKILRIPRIHTPSVKVEL